MDVITREPVQVVEDEGFVAGTWQNTIDVRDFVLRNLRPYDGDEAFLCPATERTMPPQPPQPFVTSREQNPTGKKTWAFSILSHGESSGRHVATASDFPVAIAAEMDEKTSALGEE